MNLRELSNHRYTSLARNALLVLALGFALYWFATAVHPHYPIGEWLFWVYARLWVWCGLFTIACASAGNVVMGAIGAKTMPLRERVVMTMAVGALVFFHLMFVGGVLGLYGPVFAIAMPMLMIAAGAVPLVRLLKRGARHIRAARARSRTQLPWYWYPALAFGALGLVMVYSPILSPRNIAFDSHFYHLGLAQQYAVQGAIRATPEAWIPAAIPHLASVLYTWPFILPGLNMFERLVGAAHLEMVMFLWTLAGIPSLVRWLVPRAQASVSWVALFLFPGIHVYDSTVCATADHVAAFFAVPIFLALRRVWRTFAPRDCLLLAAALSGALLTKYNAMYLMPFVALAVAGCGLWTIVRSHRPRFAARRVLLAMAVLVLAGLVLTAPHWLKNWVHYGDPLFPYLHRIFPPTRWVPDVGQLLADWEHWQLKSWRPQGTLGERLRQTGEALVFFSFEPHDWPKFHGTWPVFGSLFTLSLLLLPFVRGARRTWAVAAATLLGVGLWFWTGHQDRYLQPLVPWMACVVAATIILVWRAHWSAKPLLVGLIAAQVIWGGDAWFIPSHAMHKNAAVEVTADLIGMGYGKQYDQRWEMGGLFAIGRDPALPGDATILLHEHNPRLGLWRPVVMDVAGWQFGMRYELFETAAALDRQLRGYGVTHILTREGTSRGFDSLGADLRFFGYVTFVASKVKSFGELTLYALPANPPAATDGDMVAYLGCGKQYERGLHPIGNLFVRETQAQTPPPRIPALRAARKAEELRGVIEEADFVVTDNHCKPAPPAGALDGLVKIAERKHDQLWAR